MVKILKIIIEKVSRLETLTYEEYQVIKKLYQKTLKMEDHDTIKLIVLLMKYAGTKKRTDRVFVADEIQTHLLIMRMKRKEVRL